MNRIEYLSNKPVLGGKARPYYQGGGRDSDIIYPGGWKFDEWEAALLQRLRTSGRLTGAQKAEKDSTCLTMESDEQAQIVAVQLEYNSFHPLLYLSSSLAFNCLLNRLNTAIENNT